MIISVDLSMRSTGICISHNDRFYFGAYMSKTKTKKYVSDDQFISKRKYLKRMCDDGDFFLRLYDYDKYSYDNHNKYHIRKNREFVSMRLLASDIYETIIMLRDFIVPGYRGECIVSFEDYIKPSMGGSRTAQIIDITNMLKMILVNNRVCTEDDVFPFSSSTIKATAGSGRYDKEKMVSAMIDRYPGLLNILPSDWNSKPVDDVVDAFWINILTIKNFK